MTRECHFRFSIYGFYKNVVLKSTGLRQGINQGLMSKFIKLWECRLVDLIYQL